MIDEEPNMVRVTLTLPPFDVDLLDRLASLEGSNRSAELRTLLRELRPMLIAAVEAFEGARRARSDLEKAAAQATVEHLAAIMPRAEAVQREYLGALATLEGLEAADPRPSSHGGHTPTPPADTSIS